MVRTIEGSTPRGRFMPAPGEGTAGLSRRLINKASHRRHARAGDRGEIGALGDDRASLRGQLPAEADAVVMPIYHPGAAEAAAGKTRLHGPHHAIDRSVPFAGHQRIDIAGAVAESVGNQPLPPVGIDLVPYGDVTLDQIIELAHFWLLVYGTFSCASEVSAMPKRRSITSKVIGRCIRGGVSCAHGTAASRGRRALAGVAFASPSESARSRSGGRHIDPASVVSRDWAGTTEPRYAVASRRAARRAPARAKRIVGSGGVRAGLSRALPRGPGTRRGPHRYRLGAGRPRALPGDRCRSPLEVGGSQRGSRAAVARSGSGSAAATCQCAARGVASQWISAAHRQSRRMAGTPIGAAAAPDRADCGS